MNGILDGLLAILGFCYYALLALWAFVSQVLLPVLSIALLVIAFLLVAVVLRTLLQPRKYSNYYPEPDPEREQLCAEKLSAMVQVETVSTRGVSEPEKFRRLHAVMRELFPKVFETCEVTDLDGNLLLKWKGKSDKDPIMLMSHLDVVPAGSGWKAYEPPFSPPSRTAAENTDWALPNASVSTTLGLADVASIVAV